MLKDITIGQYIPSDSWVHRLDPRVKLIISMLYIFMVFKIKALWGFIPMALALLFVVYLAKLPLKYLLKGLKPLRMILLITFLVNLLMTPGEPLVYKALGFITISKDGLEKAVYMCFRLSFLIVGTSILTLTTSPIALTEAIENLLEPLKKIGIPIHEFAMMMTIALRFIPTLMEEADKIMKAQSARGADFESGNIISRAKNMVPLLVPMFLISFHRAEELGIAMESRCYRGDQGRTRMNPLHYAGKDAVAVLGVLLFFGALLAVQRWI